MATELVSPESFDVPNKRQTNFTLAAAIGCGQTIINPNSDILAKEIRKYLNNSTKTKNDKFEIIWGPAVVIDSQTNVPANITAVFRNTTIANDYRLALSGTNPNSPLDKFEDNTVVPTVEFRKYVSNCPSDVGIAIGTATALDRIFETTPTNSSISLKDFLKTLPKQSALTFTGHSLGGVLASTLALYFSQSPGYPQHIHCDSFAAPTAGNAAFAAYSDLSLGGKMNRFWHRYDVVPYAWNIFTMQYIQGIYPGLTAPKQFVDSINDARDLLIFNDVVYAQPGTFDTFQQIELEGELRSNMASYLDEVGWQHLYGYLKPLGLSPADLNDGHPWPQSTVSPT